MGCTSQTCCLECHSPKCTITDLLKEDIRSYILHNYFISQDIEDFYQIFSSLVAIKTFPLLLRVCVLTINHRRVLGAMYPTQHQQHVDGRNH